MKGRFMKHLIIFIDSGDTIINEATQVYDDRHIVTSAECIPEAGEVLKELYEEGYRIALVADGEWESFENVYRANGLGICFEQWIVSEVVGEQKPARSMFDTAMEKMGLTEKDKPYIVMIGNNLKKDIAGANRYGITSIWLDWSQRYFHTMEEADWMPTYQVKTPRELKALLEKLEAKCAEKMIKKVGIVACSNGQSRETKEQNQALIRFLEENGMNVSVSHCIYEALPYISGTAKEKADELMKLYLDPDVEEIYDISGGDMANQVLNFLDFEQIGKSAATFWGYSDLTTVINAIYTMTGKEGVLYQVKHMVRGNHQALQRQRFLHRAELFQPEFQFVSGTSMKGIVVGGNIRCFLKLAGTKYFPDLEGKLLLLEALGGKVPQISTYLAQLSQLGAFEKVNGIILGTFSEMEREQCSPDVISLIKAYAGDLPIAKTEEIGHGSDAKAMIIGRELEI